MSIDKTKSMFAMQYTGIVNPNLLKGTSNEWSEWYTVVGRADGNTNVNVKFLVDQWQSGDTLTASCELQIKDIQLMSGCEWGDFSSGAWIVATMTPYETYEHWNNQMFLIQYQKEAATMNKQCYLQVLEGGTTYYTLNFSTKQVSCSIRFRRLKLEQGTVATPWCKHVDD